MAQAKSGTVSPALAQLRRLQKSLYDKAHAEAHSVVVELATRTLLAYSTQFEQSLPSSYARSSVAEVQERIRECQFVLYGDFHTLRQSQRGLLRLLRSYTERMRTRRIVIALEMFKAIDQDHLDAYLAGKLAEHDFLAAIDYQAEWGFPWQNFKMILDFAKTHHLPVIGINSDNGGRDTLAKRDDFAAKRLAEAALKYPDSKIVCLIGEYHLAEAHLPRCLARTLRRLGQEPRILRILNNVDRYYFDLQEESPSKPTEYLKLKKDLYCIMNSPPWMKWQSFSIWEDMRHSGLTSMAEQEGEIDEDFDLHTEDSFDVDYQFLAFIKNLAAFLNINVDDSDTESFHILFSPGGDFFREIESEFKIEKPEAKRIVARASIDGVYFMPRTKRVFLTYMSINNLAEAAGQYLHAVLSGFVDTTDEADADFYRRIVKSAVGMIASKILNPRRKCMELHHYRQFLRRHKGERLSGPAAARRQTASAVIKYDEWMQRRLMEEDGAYISPPRAITIRDRQSNYEISRSIGQILGYNLYKKVLANKAPSSRIKRLFKRRLNSGETVWGELRSLHTLLQR